MWNSNITLEQYIEIVEKAKSAALYDMDCFDMFELHNPNKTVFSLLGVQLFCRDDEDCSWVLGHNDYELFLRFNPNLMRYIRKESISLLKDEEPGKESAKDRLYWKVTKYKKVRNVMCKMYHAYFSLDCQLVAVRWDGSPLKNLQLDYRRNHENSEEDIELSDSECFLRDSARQLNMPLNVELPYQPGDILYIDLKPYGKPFYAVYAADTDADKEHFEWTLREYGFYKRSHPCLYISEDRDGLEMIHLPMQIESPDFPYVPLDRIKVVDACDNPLLSKASALLKENPHILERWGNLSHPRLLEEDVLSATIPSCG